MPPSSVVGVTLNTISGSITIKVGLSVTLYIVEHLLVEASPGPLVDVSIMLVTDDSY